MVERIEGIITDIIKHSDRHNVVTLYTRQYGRMAFLIPVGTSKTGRLRNALVSLMAVISADVNIRHGKDLYTLRQVAPVKTWHGIYANPVKISLLFFIAEFCNKLIRQYPSDRILWEYLIDSLAKLDSIPTNRLANFHICFLIRLLSLTGIFPAVTGYEPGMHFDMLAAEMIDSNHPSFKMRKGLLNEWESSLIPTFAKINFQNMHLFRFTKTERERLLDRILEYYSLHLPIGKDYKTLSVLHDIFA